MKQVAVVILNWNGEKILKEFLPTVVAFTPENLANIYIADNGSTDNSVNYVRENFPLIKIIELDKNYGFAGGYNLAIKHIKEPFTILLNSDVAVTENWIEPLLSYMESNLEVAACQPKILSYQNKEYFEYAGAAGGYIDKYGYPFCKGRILNIIEKDTGQYDQISEIFWASGACLVIRTESYKELGGLDELFFAHMEEIDLCWRIWARGKKVVCVPQSVVYHLGGATLHKMNPFKTYLNFRNNWYLLYKNKSKKLRRLLFLRYFLDYVAVVKFLLNFEFKNALAVFKAHYHFFKTLKKLKPYRKENLEKTVCTDIPTIYKKSIIFQFFLKHKRFFSELDK